MGRNQLFKGRVEASLGAYDEWEEAIGGVSNLCVSVLACLGSKEWDEGSVGELGKGGSHLGEVRRMAES